MEGVKTLIYLLRVIFNSLDTRRIFFFRIMLAATPY